MPVPVQQGVTVTVQEDARAAARRIVEEVLADHAARSATPAAPARVERTSTVPPAPQVIPAAPIAATNHPDTPAWRTARRIVDEVLAAHASTSGHVPSGDTLVADPPNVVAVGSTPIDSLEVPTLLIDVSDSSTEVAVVSEAVSPVPVDGIPEELFAGHVVVSEADGDEPTATAPTVEPPARPDVEPVPDDPVPVDPDPVPVDPDPVPVDPEPEPLEPQPVPIDSDVGKPPAVTPAPTAPVSTEAATVASRIVAEVLADHAEREAAAAVAEAQAAAVAEAQAAGTAAQLPPATHEMTGGPGLFDDPSPDLGAVLTDAPPPLADEVETRDRTLDLDEVQGPRRTGRWLMTTVVGAVALGLLFPLAVRALRELISLG